MLRLLPLLFALVLLTACGGSRQASGKPLLVVVNAPFSRTPYLGRTIENGVRLAAADVNAGGGVRIGGHTYPLKVRVLDSALSPAHSVVNVRRAVADGAIAIVDEGTGVDASWRIAAKRGVPIGIVFEGDEVSDEVEKASFLKHTANKSL